MVRPYRPTAPEWEVSECPNCERLRAAITREVSDYHRSHGCGALVDENCIGCNLSALTDEGE